MTADWFEEFSKAKCDKGTLQLRQEWIDKFRTTAEYVRTVIEHYACNVRLQDEIAEIGFEIPSDFSTQANIGHALTQLEFLKIAKRVTKKAGKPYVVQFNSITIAKDFFDLKPLSYENCIDRIRQYIVEQRGY